MAATEKGEKGLDCARDEQHKKKEIEATRTRSFDARAGFVSFLCVLAGGGSDTLGCMPPPTLTAFS